MIAPVGLILRQFFDVWQLSLWSMALLNRGGCKIVMIRVRESSYETDCFRYGNHRY